MDLKNESCPNQWAIIMLNKPRRRQKSDLKNESHPGVLQIFDMYVCVYLNYNS